jgi:hypothetical protein
VITAIGVDKTDKRREVNRLVRSNNGKSVMFKIRRGEQQLEKMVELKKEDPDEDAESEAGEEKETVEAGGRTP